MGTRSFIGRVSETNDGDPSGVYCHWDGYPEGVGAELFFAIREHFKGDVEAAAAFFIDQHPAGWSSICGKDWDLEPGFLEHNEQPCRVCGRKDWEHYRQYYQSKGLPLPDDAIATPTALIRDHFPEAVEDLRPQCYCHGDRHEEAWDLTLSKAAGSGCEYAYILSPESRKLYVLSSYSDGEKMIGWFGTGDAKSDWVLIGEVDLDGPEPDWKKMTEQEVEVA